MAVLLAGFSRYHEINDEACHHQPTMMSERGRS
jgi:hypothetical protein